MPSRPPPCRSRHGSLLGAGASRRSGASTVGARGRRGPARWRQLVELVFNTVTSNAPQVVHELSIMCLNPLNQPNCVSQTLAVQLPFAQSSWNGAPAATRREHREVLSPGGRCRAVRLDLNPGHRPGDRAQRPVDLRPDGHQGRPGSGASDQRASDRGRSPRGRPGQAVAVGLVVAAAKCGDALGWCCFGAEAER